MSPEHFSKNARNVIYLVSLKLNEVIKTSLSIGNIKAAKGEKKTGFLTVAELPTGTIDLPITIINGAKSGPTLLVTAGVHGCEYPGIRGAQIIASETKPSELSGSIVIAHHVNVPGYVTQTAFFNPLDGINLNRIWPGDIQSVGSTSHHIANNVYEKLQKKATHYIDLHGGDLPEDIPQFSASVFIGDDKVDNVSKEMMKYSLAKYLQAGSLGIGGTTTSAAAKLKIPNLLHEAGKAGLLQKTDVEQHVNAVRNNMKYLGMIAGKPVEPRDQVQFGKWVGVKAKHGGFFQSLVEAGETVSEGQIIGKIYSPFGEAIEDIKAPQSGVVLIINFRAAKSTGDPLISIAQGIK